MTEIKLLVITTDEKREVPVAQELLENTDVLISNLKERGVPVPQAPVLNKTEAGTYVLSEQPVFG